MAKMRVLLAYSGGLDTSIIVPWLKENYDCDVICVAGDVGQGEELEPLHEKAKKCGAEKLYIEDLRKEFVEPLLLCKERIKAAFNVCILHRDIFHVLIQACNMAGIANGIEKVRVMLNRNANGVVCVAI